MVWYLLPPSYRIPGATLTGEPGCPAAPPSGGGRFLMALELSTEFKVALTPSRGWLQRAVATRATKNWATPTAPRAFISELKREKEKEERNIALHAWSPGSRGGAASDQTPGSLQLSQGPDCGAHGALHHRHQGCLYTAGSEHSGPSGGDNKAGMGFQSSGRGPEGVCLCTRRGALDTLHPAPCAVVLDQLTFGVIVISSIRADYFNKSRREVELRELGCPCFAVEVGLSESEILLRIGIVMLSAKALFSSLPYANTGLFCTDIIFSIKYNLVSNSKSQSKHLS